MWADRDDESALNNARPSPWLREGFNVYYTLYQACVWNEIIYVDWMSKDKRNKGDRIGLPHLATDYIVYYGKPLIAISHKGV